MLEGFLSDDLEGPVSEEEFLREIHAGRIGPKAKVMSPTVTKGAWVRLQTLPSYVRVSEEGKAERQRLKQEQAEQKRRQRELKAQKEAEQKRLGAEARTQAYASEPQYLAPTRGGAYNVALLKIFGIISLGVLVFVAAIFMDHGVSALGGLICGGTFAAVMFVMGVVLAALVPGAEKCPQCGRRGGLIAVGRFIVDQRKCYGLVTRHGSSSHLGATFGGNEIRPAVLLGSTSFQDRAPVIRTTYRITHRCQHCSATYWNDEVHEVEDFE